MKLIQTPSLITGVILGASLITLSAASNDSVLEGLKVFFPGTEVSSADVNHNFTYLDDGMTTLEGRMDSLEGSVSAPEVLYYEWPTLAYGTNGDNLSLTVPEGFAYRILEGHTLFSDSGIINFQSYQYINSTRHGCILVVDGLSSIPFSNDIDYFLAGNSTDGERPRRAVTFPSGTTITFQGRSASGVTSEGIYVCIEKIPFSSITPGQ